MTNSTTTTVATRAVLFAGSGGGGVSYGIQSNSPVVVLGIGKPPGHEKGLPSLFTKPCTDSRLPNLTFNPVISFTIVLRFAVALNTNCTFSSWFRVMARRKLSKRINCVGTLSSLLPVWVELLEL